MEPYIAIHVLNLIFIHEFEMRLYAAIDWWLIYWCIFIFLSRESGGVLFFGRTRTRLVVDYFRSITVDVWLLL